MSGTENILFDDKNVKPTDEMVFSHIGDKRALWIELMSHLGNAYPDSDGQWRYYNDGKRWLYKQVCKKKTLFWLTVYDNAFRVTFYFGDKAEPMIEAGNLPQKIKDDFKTGKRYGKIRAVSIPVTDQEDIEKIRELIAIRSKIK